MNKVPFPSEKAIEDYLWDVLKEDDYCPMTERYVSFSYRQFEIKGYGITDLIHVIVSPFEVEVVIVELKNEILKEAHLSQLARYMRGMRRFVRRYEKVAMRKCWEISVKGILAGPFSVDGDFVYLLDQLEDVEVYNVSLTMESGFNSEQVGSGWFNKRENPDCISVLAKGIFDEATRMDKQVRNIRSAPAVNFPRGLN